MADDRPKTERPPTRDTLDPTIRLALAEREILQLQRDTSRTEGKLEGRIDKLEKAAEPPKPPPRVIWPYVVGIFTMLGTGGNWIWQAAKYPDRVEFDRANAEAASKIEKLEQQRERIELELARMQAAAAARAPVEDVLTKALAPAHGGKPR